MSVARDTIKELRNPGNHKVAKTDIKWNLNTFTRSNQWVQWNVRKIKGVRTYYEVYNPDPKQEILWVEFHVKGNAFKILKSVSGLEKLLERSKDSMYGVKVDVRNMDLDKAVKKVRRQLEAVYKVVEVELKKSKAKIESMTKRGTRDGSALPRMKVARDRNPTMRADWHLNYRCNEDYLDRGYDERFNGVNGLTWLPWVGKNYNNARLLVVGESNYADRADLETVESAVGRVNGDRWFTRKIVSAFGADRIISNKTFEGIARMLNVNEDAGEVDAEFSSAVWKKVVYVDLLQRALRGKGWNQDEERARPSEGRAKNEERAFWVEGCRVIFNLIELLEPHAVLCVGCGAADWLCGACPENLQWRCERVDRDYRVCEGNPAPRLRMTQIWNGETAIPVIGVPNPGGARGFDANAQIRVKNEILLNDDRFIRCLRP